MTDMLSKSQLNRMSISKLQIIVNHVHSQIEGKVFCRNDSQNLMNVSPDFSELNEKLVKLLFERDELLMEQDSLLVDIDDETIFL